MYRLHLQRNLRSLAFLMVVALLLSATGLLIWANSTGMPQTWRTAIELELEKKGITAHIGSLKYIPFRGIIASDVKILSQSTNSTQASTASTLQSVLLKFDNSKLARGHFDLLKVEFYNASVSIPITPSDPNSKNIHIQNAFGTVFFPGNQRVEIRNARGSIANISISLDAKITGYRAKTHYVPNQSSNDEYRQWIATIFEEITHWEYPINTPPKIHIYATGDLNTPDTLSSKISFSCPEIGKNQRYLQNISLNAEYNNHIVTLTHFSATDSRGSISGCLDFDTTNREGRFELDSSIHLESLLRKWFNISQTSKFTIAGHQKISCNGQLKFPPNAPPDIHIFGKTSLTEVMTFGILLKSIESSFAYSNHQFFLRDLKIDHQDGFTAAKVMIDWPSIRIAANTTIPPHVLLPLVHDNPVLSYVINQFKSSKKSSYTNELEVNVDASNPASWSVIGSGSIKNFSFNNVQLNLAQCKYTLSQECLDFTDGKVDFNYSDYPLRKEFSGPNSGSTTVGRIRYNHKSHLIDVENVVASAWAAPIIRLFAPAIADHVEIYKFHTPPDLIGNGIVDVGKKNQTNLTVHFKSKSAATYPLLSKDTVLTAPSGTVIIRNNLVSVQNIATSSFNGPIRCNVEYSSSTNKLSVNADFTKISLPQLADHYNLKNKFEGSLTGRIDFTLNPGKIDSMNGSGLFALDNTELFAVPLFGPLSRLINTVLNDRRAGIEHAKSAFCNFTIDNGMARTNDFQTSTKSLTFTGDGSVDLSKNTIDMTIRMNARGLFGLITLPLKPFYGMFQFRGTGPTSNTTWEHVMFTSPTNDDLKNPPPPKAIILQN